MQGIDRLDFLYQSIRVGLCRLHWLQIDDTTLQTSFRSIIWEDKPVPNGFERIDWWGGHLFEANPDGTSQLVLIDRENQGGQFPAFMMNLIMPQYLTHQFESIIKFFKNGGVDGHEKLSDANNTALKMNQI